MQHSVSSMTLTDQAKETETRSLVIIRTFTGPSIPYSHHGRQVSLQHLKERAYGP
jgi:hypothetical protein